MKMNMYSIYDTATGAYMRPFFLQSDGQALRMFEDIVMDAEHEVGKHPEDYSVARIGLFNDQTAELTDENVEILATGMEMVAKGRKVNGEQLQLNEEIYNA